MKIQQMMSNPLYILVVLSCAFIFSGCSENRKDFDLNKYNEHVLFIGNSYTYRNRGVDQHLLELYRNSGDSSVYCTRAAKGKYHLYTHWKDSLTKTLFDQHKWNTVVLQEFSSGPVREEKEFKSYAKKWAAKIRKHNPRAKIYLYATWGYKKSKGMTDSLYQSYLKIGKSIHAEVIPVGLLWKSLENKINLYDGDGAHPNRKGTFVNSCLFYEVMSKRDVRKTPHTDKFLDKKTQRLLKSFVHNFVLRHKL
jgi:hypothetical protein